MIEYLSGFMLPGREKVLRETLANRTRYMTICLENTYHPQNASALVRNCEAFGIQDIHTVETVCRFTPNANIVRGTDKWSIYASIPIRLRSWATCGHGATAS